MVLENFLGYTEVDPWNKISIASATHIDVTNLDRNEDAYVYDDKGAGHFTNFEHLIDVQITSAGKWSMQTTWGVANDIDDQQALETKANPCLSILFYNNNNALQFYLREWDGTNIYTAGPYTFSLNTWYYFTINKTGTSFTCKIYSDSARTNLLTTLSITLQANHTFRYIYPINAWNAGVTPRLMSSDIENLDLEAVGLELIRIVT